mmetsp:Transcript_29050/g.56575  ORF Transcript_29050/g.56575 Transcript_29050/m.56575 type:complete len:279 (+) Transcript_29050:1369-2205(+)
MPDHLFEDRADHALKRIENVLLGYVRHLAVDLSEFRLAVRSELLVTEALDDLEVAVHPGYHQNLLECLGRLRQSVKLAGIHSRWHHEVTGTLGGGLHKHGRLNLNEPFTREVVSHHLCELVSQNEGVLHWGTTDIKVPELHSNFFQRVGLGFNEERWGLRRVQNLDAGWNDFDISGGFVLRLRSALNHLSSDLDNILTSQLCRNFVALFLCLFLFCGSIIQWVGEHGLCDTVTVTNVNECHALLVTALLNPAADAHLFANVADSQLPTVVGSVARLGL